MIVNYTAYKIRISNIEKNRKGKQGKGNHESFYGLQLNSMLRGCLTRRAHLSRARKALREGGRESR